MAWYVAALVPLSALAVFYVAMLLEQTWRGAEEVAVDRARGVIADVDATLQRDLAALSLIARLRPWQESAGGWFQNALAEFPQWREVAATDTRAGSTIRLVAASLATPYAAEQDALALAAGGTDYRVSGIEKARFGCVCVEIQERRDGVVLTLLRDASDLYALLSAEAEPGEVAALVDREGRFVARSLDNAGRAGELATPYVRKAITRGGEGVYDGVTWEGLKNRTAYATSELAGWSVHIAVPARGYRLLSTGYFVFALIAIGVALAFAGGVSWLGLRDLKLARQRERARLQSEKLEAVGALSSAIVHDFNNLLTIIDACFGILKVTDNPERRARAVREGLGASERGAQLVKRLLGFVRDKPPDIVCVDLLATMEDVRDLVARSLGSAIALDVEIAPDARHALTSRSQLELVLLNFAANARDAMPEGGEFSIVSRRSSASGCVDLVIRDTGPGMAADVAARAFEPFFTTKPEGKGTGLGLAQAQMLAVDSGAKLTLETAPGKGCAFVYSFRACAPP